MKTALILHYVLFVDYSNIDRYPLNSPMFNSLNRDEGGAMYIQKNFSALIQ